MDIGRRQCALTDVRIVECSRRIRKERDLIIAEHGVACRCVTAVFRRRAGYDCGFDAPFPQYQIKVGREERAIAVFFDDVLAWRQRQVFVDLGPRRSIDQTAACTLVIALLTIGKKLC